MAFHDFDQVEIVSYAAWEMFTRATRSLETSSCMRGSLEILSKFVKLTLWNLEIKKWFDEFMSLATDNKGILGTNIWILTYDLEHFRIQLPDSTQNAFIVHMWHGWCSRHLRRNYFHFKWRNWLEYSRVVSYGTPITMAKHYYKQYQVSPKKYIASSQFQFSLSTCDFTYLLF